MTEYTARSLKEGDVIYVVLEDETFIRTFTIGVEEGDGYTVRKTVFDDKEKVFLCPSYVRAKLSETFQSEQSAKEHLVEQLERRIHVLQGQLTYLQRIHDSTLMSMLTAQSG